MHILFLTDNFPPEVNAPASRTFEHCREWVREGHRVTVVTCAPNFPNGKVFGGYKNRLWQVEELSGMRVIRVWTYITANDGFVKRILDYLSFMVAGTIASLFVRDASIVIGTSPQFFTACGAYVVSRVKRIPFVFELRDLWPESIKAVGAMRDSRLLRMLERLELFLYRKANLIVSVTQSFRNVLIGRGIADGKIVVVTNGVDMERFAPGPKDRSLLAGFGLEGKFVVGYIGTHGLAHGLETILDVAEMVQAEPGGAKFHFILLGDGARKEFLVSDASRRGLRNVLFIDSVSKDQVPHYWSLLDAAIIHLKNTPLFSTVIPSKLFECMGMGIPVLHGVLGESADIVRRKAVGIPFQPGDPADLRQALLRLYGQPELLQQLRANCRAAAKRYDRVTLAREMLRALENCSRGIAAG